MSQEVGELEQTVAFLDISRYCGDDLTDSETGEVISQEQFYNIRKQLEKASPDSKALLSRPSFPLVKHNPPMRAFGEIGGSGDEKIKELSDLLELDRDGDKEEEEFVFQHYRKVGVPVALYYQEGELALAVLRSPGGEEGEDVTRNIAHVKGVPQKLPTQDTCVIWGDIECLRPAFRKILEDWQNVQYRLDAEPKNARLFAADSIRLEDESLVDARQLSFTAHTLVKGKEFDSEAERAKYVREILGIPHVEVQPFRWRDLPVLEEFSSRLDCDVDGLVVSSRGFKKAWKFADPSIVVEVKEVDWRPDENDGKLVPYLLFDSFRLGGKVVRELPGHSFGFLSGKAHNSVGKINRWADVRIAKRGVPRIVGVVREAYSDVKPPDECPHCKGQVDTRGDDLYCVNEFCGVRSVARITHFLDTMGVKGLAKGIVSRLLESGLVRYPDQLYNLTVDSLGTIGYNKRQALNIIAKLYLHPDPHKANDQELKKFLDEAYKKTIKVPAWKLLAALGIPGVGQKVSEAVIGHFGSFAKVREATASQWEKAKLGDFSEAIQEFFENYDGMVDYLVKVVEPV